MTRPVVSQRVRERIVVRLVLLVVGVGACLLMLGSAASAHVIPTSTVQLEVHQTSVTALVSIPLTDAQTAAGINLGDGSQAAVDAKADAIRAYLRAHFAPTTDDGRPWAVAVGQVAVAEVGDPAVTGRYRQLQTRATLTPPAGSTDRSFNLGYDAVVDREATHVVIVTVRSDWAAGRSGSAYEVGTVRRDTVTNTVRPLHVALGAGSSWRGFVSMVSLGMQHIREGTDHQLFLLSLLLSASLVATAGRWSGSVSPRRAWHRIATITVAFTLGHSTTLALGALGLPVPQHLVESGIALSILVAAAHALRPIFPGREALVAGAFGLVHGLAFSQTLRELDLTGARLVLSLLGFNLGIELMQLVVVALVLPPLLLLARADRYRALRVSAAAVTAVAAMGWLLARLGVNNPVAAAADRLGLISIPVVVILWVTAVAVTFRSRRRPAPIQSAQPLDRKLKAIPAESAPPDRPAPAPLTHSPPPSHIPD